MSEIEDYKRFLSSNPENEQYYKTLTLSHSLMSKTYNLVADTVELIAGDELGNLVTYEPASIKFTGTSQNNDLDQTSTYTISDVENKLDSEMDRIPLGDGEPIIATFRGYHSKNLNTPIESISFNVESVSQIKGAFTLKTGVPNLNSDQTGENYNLQDFPIMRALF